MIPAIHPRGTNVGGLLRYLYGPGMREEHTDAHLVAAWADAGPLSTLEPATTGAHRDIRRLAGLLEQPVGAGRAPPRKTVWHCSIRTHSSDRRLTDGQWAHIAGEVMAAVGLAPHGDDRAVRWVAVRHADDHIHLVATLVRQDRLTAWTRYDYRKAQQACRDLEHRYGLYRLAPPGAGSRRWPGPRELNKAERLRAAIPPREDLRRRVRAAAAVATDETDFFTRLAALGVTIRPRHSNQGPISGYAVSLPGHTTATNQPIWYGGSRLAPDLALPRLRTRWAGMPAHLSAPARAVARAFAGASGRYQVAADTVRQAAAELTGTTDRDVSASLATAVADVLAATAQRREGRRGGPLTTAADLLDRAAHEPHHRRQVQASPLAAHLRTMGRTIALLSRVADSDEARTTLTLIYSIAGFAEALAQIRAADQRPHQAQAARDAATRLRIFTPKAARTPPQPVATPGQPLSTQPLWTPRRRR